jgi:hypothetical protein
MKLFYCYIVILLFGACHLGYGKNKLDPGQDSLCLPADSNAMVIWYNRTACRGCFIEVNNYLKDHKNNKVYIGIYYDHLSPLQKREIINSFRNELMPDCTYEIFFVSKDKCPGIAEKLADFTPAISIVSAGNERFFSYTTLFKDNQFRSALLKNY